MTDKSNHKTGASTGHRQWLYQTLNIRADESKPVFLLIVFSFFMGLGLSFYFTASNAIFIKHFEPGMISLAFMASGVAVYLTWLLLSLIDRRLPVSARFTVKFVLVLICVLAISFGTWLHDSDLMAFILFTFVRVLVYISLVTFWGLAGKIFNLRQGKRIFGLIGAGEVISIIIGYFSVPLVLNFMKTPSLLFISSAAFLVCLLVVLVILKTFRAQIHSSEGMAAAPDIKERKQWRYLTLIRKPYFLLISFMALLPIFGYLFVDYMFLHQTKYEFHNDQETIARFFGYILGFVAVVELVFKLFVSGRLLNKYGLKPSMLSLPVVLLISTLMASMFGTFYGPAGIFFAFIVFSRLLERSVRGAIFEPAFQLLYQPVPAGQRLAFQSQIEGIPKALGTILTGAILWIFSVIPAFNLVFYNYFFLLVIVIWILIATRMFKAYRGRIKELLSGEKTVPEPDTLSATTSCIMEIDQSIQRQSPGEFQKFFHLVEEIEPVRAEAILHDMLLRSPGPLKAEIIRYIEQMQVVSAKKALLQIKDSRKFKNLDPLIESALAELKLADTYSIELLSNLAGSNDPEERETAARLLAYTPQYRTIRILTELQHDPHPAVRKAALITSGKVKRIELWPGILDNLAHPECGSTAFSALRNIGEPVLDRLEEIFRKAGNNKKMQILVIKLFRSIGGTRAKKHLRAKISHPDTEVRLQVLLSLCRLGYQADYQEKILIKQTIEQSIEVMVWIMAAIQDIGEGDHAEQLLEALNGELSDKREQIFLLLSLIFDAQTIRLIREHIESGSRQSKIFALEISDMTVTDEMKEMLLPLFDDLSIPERLALFRYRFPQQNLNRLDRLSDIINKDYNVIRKWTKACAIQLLAQYTRDQVAEILRANLVNPSWMIRETAAWVLYSLDPDAYWDILAVQQPDVKRGLEGITKSRILEHPHQGKLLIMEKTEILNQSAMFSGLPGHALAELAMHAKDLSFEKGKQVPVAYNGLTTLYYIATGRISSIKNKQIQKTFAKNDLLIMGVEMTKKDGSQLVASDQCMLLQISMGQVIQLIRDYPAFTGRFLTWYAST